MKEEMPWFRMYAEAVDDEKLRLLAFEDRWHYVAILCCKCMGLLDAGDTASMLRRKMAVKLGLAMRELDAMADRLAELDLIDPATFQPTAWDNRQMRSDSSKERVRAFRERQARVKQLSNVTETAQDTDTDKELLTDRSPQPTPSAAVGGSFEGHVEPKPTPNPAAAYAIALNKAGFGCTSYTPALVAYVGDGGTVEHLLQVIAANDCSGKPAGYVLSIARRELTERAAPVVPGSSRPSAPPVTRTAASPEATRAALDAVKPKKPADPEAAQRAIEEARRELAGFTNAPSPIATPRASPEEREAAERELAAMRDRKSQAAGADA